MKARNDNYRAASPEEKRAKLKLQIERTYPKLTIQIIKEWFVDSGWFDPSEDQIENFQSLLRAIYVSKISDQKKQLVGLPKAEKWEVAVQTLCDELETVIIDTVRFEDEIGLMPGDKSKVSALLAKLLLTAREVIQLRQPYPGLSIDLQPKDEKNERSTAIFNYLNKMAKQAGRNQLTPSSRNTKILSIVVSAMEACGWAVTEAGVAKTIRDHGRDIVAMRIKKSAKSMSKRPQA